MRPLQRALRGFDAWITGRKRYQSGTRAALRATDAPGRGFHWGTEAHHSELPRGQRVEFSPVGTLEEILFGPSRVADGTMNLIGALRRSLATTGYTELKEFQRVEVVVG